MLYRKYEHAANGISLKKGDEVLLTSHEHVGGALPWLGRQKREGVVVKTFEPAMYADETLERLKRAVTRRTKVISVSHITCTTGAILPVKQICAYAREQNIRTVIDGAQVVGQDSDRCKRPGM
jgi:cysteine desulfurase / selenocysteine lyase